MKQKINIFTSYLKAYYITSLTKKENVSTFSKKKLESYVTSVVEYAKWINRNKNVSFVVYNTNFTSSLEKLLKFKHISFEENGKSIILSKDINKAKIYQLQTDCERYINPVVLSACDYYINKEVKKINLKKKIKDLH